MPQNVSLEWCGKKIPAVMPVPNFQSLFWGPYENMPENIKKSSNLGPLMVSTAPAQVGHKHVDSWGKYSAAISTYYLHREMSDRRS